jgi:DNA-binding FadR family transcriptional regulator
LGIRQKTPEGYFYYTRNNFKNNLGFSSHKQREAIKRLREKGILETETGGFPEKDLLQDKFQYS